MEARQATQPTEHPECIIEDCTKPATSHKSGMCASCGAGTRYWADKISLEGVGVLTKRIAQVRVWQHRYAALLPRRRGQLRRVK